MKLPERISHLSIILGLAVGMVFGLTAQSLGSKPGHTAIVSLVAMCAAAWLTHELVKPWKN